LPESTNDGSNEAFAVQIPAPTARRHPLASKESGGRTALEFFLSGLKGWDSETQRKLMF
jgi:hypothetical protein